MSTEESNTRQMEPANVLRFIEGFALGLCSDLKSPETIPTDAPFIDTLHKAYEELQLGLKDWSVTQIENGLVTFGKSMQQLAEFLRAAETDENELLVGLERLCSDMKTWTGTLFVIKDEVMNIWSHKDEITKDVQNFVTYWEACKYELAGVQAGRIVEILIAGLDSHAQWIVVDHEDAIVEVDLEAMSV